MLIYLIGMPACGKTTWGQSLAKLLDFDFIDTDAWIEQRHQQSVKDLFALGEDVFRKKEQQAIMEIASSNKTNNVVVATGGGLPCFFDNIEVLKNSGYVIYLERTVEELLQHLENDDNKRPLLNKSVSLRAKLQQQLQEREIFYKQSHYQIKNPDKELFALVKSWL